MRTKVTAHGGIFKVTGMSASSIIMLIVSWTTSFSTHFFLTDFCTPLIFCTSVPFVLKDLTTNKLHGRLRPLRAVTAFLHISPLRQPQVYRAYAG